MRNLLAIVQTAALELGLPSTTLVVGNSDQQVLQLLALANREGSELSQIEGGWTALRAEQLITLISGTASYAFPTDFAYYVQDAMWNRTTHWRLDGPMSANDWQVLKSGIFPSGVYMRYRIMNGTIAFDPTPTAAATIAIEYISTNWCKSASGTAQALFLADTDVPLLPDDLIILGTKWRFLAAKGFNYAEERAAYDRALSRFQPRDFVLESLNMGRPAYSYLNPGLIQAGDWPGR